MKLWNSQSGKLLKILDKKSVQIKKSFFSPDGKFLVTRSEDNTAMLWNLQFGDSLVNPDKLVDIGE